MRILTILFFLLLLCSPALHAQYGGQSDDPQFGRNRSQEDIDADQKREKAMNKDRAEQIKRDTTKLLQLATELKHYVDKTNENILSVDVIRKADEIDKLAKSIRDKMKQDYSTQEPFARP